MYIKKTPRLQTELCTYGEKRTFRPDLTNDEKTQDFTSQKFRDKVSKVNNNKFESRKIRIYVQNQISKNKCYEFHTELLVVS